jgi:CrcB protein
MGYLWVAIGSALGGMARYWMTLAMAAATGISFPWGTILINILGSFVIGLVGALTGVGGRLTVPAEARLFVMTGLCGGFTTFSAFSLQTFELVRDGRLPQAAANVALSVTLCVIAVALGYLAANVVAGQR